MNEGWISSEEQSWTESVCSPTLRYVTYGLICKIVGIYLIGEISRESLVALVLLSLGIHETHRHASRAKSQSTKRLGAFVTMELIQWTLALLSILSCPSQAIYFGLASGSFCLNFQISLSDSKPRLVFTIGKLYAMWLVASLWSQHTADNCYFPLCLFLTSLTLTIGTTNYYRVIAKDRFETNKTVFDREARISNLLEAIPDGIMVITEEMTIPTFNVELIKLLGVRQCGEVLEALRKLQYEEGINDRKKGEKRLLEDIKVLMLELNGCRTLGTTKIAGRYLEWKGRKCCWGSSQACILTIRDSSALIATQNKLKLESSYKSALIRSVSHELRTPTNAIINLVREVVDDTSLPESLSEELSLVSVCSQFLLSMINDLLDYSKVLAGKFTLNKSDFNVRNELQSIVRLFVHQCNSKSLDLRLNIDPYIPSAVYSDGTRVKQVLLNLLSNAIK